MARKILQIGNQLLRQVSELVEPDFLKSKEWKGLKAGMLETLRNQPTGVAMSAVQIGVNKQIFVIEIRALKPEIMPFGPKFYFNPEITWASEKKVKMFEACLSISEAHLFGEVERPAEIEFDYIEEEGHESSEKLSGFMARVVQHEIDHINGKLFTDIVDPETLMEEREYRKWNSRKK